MRLDKKRQEELARRQGLTGRMIIQTIWLIISFAFAYFLINYLLAEGILTYNMFYNQLSLPRSVPAWGISLGMMIIIVFFMQLFLLIGFLIASPEGRRKTGTPTLHSRNKDPFDDRGYG